MQSNNLFSTFIRCGTVLCLTCLLNAVVSGDETTTSPASVILETGVRLNVTGSRLQGWASTEVVDWDNDGLNDLLVGHYSGDLALYLNRGMTEFGLRFEPSVIRRADGFSALAKPIWAWRFNKATCVCPGPGRISPRVLDWDQDGRKDLVIGDGRGAQTRVWINIGTDSNPLFSTKHIRYFPSNAGIRPYHETVQPFVADWNNDGLDDLFMGRNRGLYVYLNRGTAKQPDFAFEQRRLGMRVRDVFPDGRLCPVVIDWHADGRLDVVAGSQHGGVWFARNVGTATSPQLQKATRVNSGGQPIAFDSEARIAVADLDGDGTRDLVVGVEDGRIMMFRGKASGFKAYARHVKVNQGKRIKVLLFASNGKRVEELVVKKQPAHGKLVVAAPTIVYQSDAEFVGSDSFTYAVKHGDVESVSANVQIDVLSTPKPPSIESPPKSDLVAIGQMAKFKVTASGAGRLSYQWNKDGEPIRRANLDEFVIRQASATSAGAYSVTVTNEAGSTTSRIAKLQVDPESTNPSAPVFGIKFVSPVIEPATSGELRITREGDMTKAVTVKLETRRAHDPVLAELHFEPTPENVVFAPGQATATVPVVPIDDTLVNGRRTILFRLVPNPSYRIDPKAKSATMVFWDDDCPNIGVSIVKGQPNTFRFSAQPAPRRDTVVDFTVSGTATEFVDYQPIKQQVTIPAGKTAIDVEVQPYRAATGSKAKDVTVSLGVHRFTFFDFYPYLTDTARRSAKLTLDTSTGNLSRPKIRPAGVAPEIQKLKSEIAKLGWIIFSARTDGGSGNFDLFAVRPDGRDLRNLTNTKRFDEFSVQVSQDGHRMMYRRSSAGLKMKAPDTTQQDIATKALRTWPTRTTLVLSDLAQKSVRPIGDVGQYAWASWSPDGSQFACLQPVEESKQGAASKPNVSQQVVIFDADTLKIIRTLPSAGIDGFARWSSDGRYLLGHANVRPGKSRFAKGIEYPIGTGKMVSLDLRTGKRMSLSSFPDWFPVWATDSDGDWFQGSSPDILHSANNYGICPAYYSMLFRSSLKQPNEPSRLVYGEYMRNVWGGCTSPDDKYAVFVIGGDSWALQGKLAIIRLADAPIARGSSPLFHEVLRDHYHDVKEGPVFDLKLVPEAFDPHWTAADLSQANVEK